MAILASQVAEGRFSRPLTGSLGLGQARPGVNRDRTRIFTLGVLVDTGLKCAANIIIVGFDQTLIHGND